MINKKAAIFLLIALTTSVTTSLAATTTKNNSITVNDLLGVPASSSKPPRAFFLKLECIDR